MTKKFTVYSAQFTASICRAFRYFLSTVNCQRSSGFTLIETLVAISLLTLSIVAPMALTAQSLATAYYARDQVTAFYLAQEAIEGVRALRDGQILQIAQCPNATECASLDIFGPIPISRDGIDRPFTIDPRESDPLHAIQQCALSQCQDRPLQTNGTLYGYESDWTDSNFTRIVRASFVGGGQDEIRVSVTIVWRTGAFQVRTFSISENMYRWVNDGSNQT